MIRRTKLFEGKFNELTKKRFGEFDSPNAGIDSWRRVSRWPLSKGIKKKVYIIAVILSVIVNRT